MLDYISRVKLDSIYGVKLAERNEMEPSGKA